MNIRITTILIYYFCFFVTSIYAQEKQASSRVYTDANYKYQLQLPANYVELKISDEKLSLREKKDIASTVRIALNIVHYQTVTASGKIYDFSNFSRSHALSLYRQGDLKKSDSLMIKDYSTNQGLKGREIYVRLVNSIQKDATGTEEQVIKGPAFIFDFSSQIGIPGTALIIHQVADDNKTSRAIRSIVDGLKIGP